MNVEYQKDSDCYQVPVKDAPKVLGHVSISKWVIEASTILLAQGSEMTPQKANYSQMRHKKHDPHSHALEENAPKILGHGSISK